MAFNKWTFAGQFIDKMAKTSTKLQGMPLGTSLEGIEVDAIDWGAYDEQEDKEQLLLSLLQKLQHTSQQSTASLHAIKQAMDTLSSAEGTRDGQKSTLSAEKRILRVFNNYPRLANALGLGLKTAGKSRGTLTSWQYQPQAAWMKQASEAFITIQNEPIEQPSALERLNSAYSKANTTLKKIKEVKRVEEQTPSRKAGRAMYNLEALKSFQTNDSAKQTLEGRKETSKQYQTDKASRLARFFRSVGMSSNFIPTESNTASTSAYSTLMSSRGKPSPILLSEVTESQSHTSENSTESVYEKAMRIFGHQIVRENIDATNVTTPLAKGTSEETVLPHLNSPISGQRKSTMKYLLEMGQKKRQSKVATNLNFNTNANLNTEAHGNTQTSSQNSTSVSKNRFNSKTNQNQPIQVTIKELVGIKNLSVEKLSDQEMKRVEQTVNKVLIRAIHQITG
ncbi:MAG: hypothetical protein ACPGJS_05465 [Flammeovirgaceae bacterium]